MSVPIDNEKFLEVCNQIAIGKPVAAAAEEAGISPASFYRHLNLNDDLLERYERARSARANVRFDRTDQLLSDIEAGKIDPNAARVILDAIKWMTGKERAMRYGDKPAEITINTDNRKVINVTDHVLRMLTNEQLAELDRLSGDDGAKVIDYVPSEKE